MGLGDRLRDRIAAVGPMRFRDWMDACLYDAEAGYYMRPGRKTGTGPEGDFATGPTLSPLLGEAVAREARRAWQGLGSPDSFTIVELGGGEGDLARAALAWMDDAGSDLAAAAQWIHVERSPVHRGAAADHRVEFAAQVPDGASFVVANEFIDALPIHLLEWRKGNWAEVFVAWQQEEGRFREVLGLPSRRAVETAPKRLMEEGQRVAAMVDAKEVIGDVARRCGPGSILLIDYGDRGKRLWTPDRSHGTVRGFRGHELVEDVLADPGAVDITASVDFTGTREWAVGAGWVESFFGSQEEWLVSHGALERLAEAPRDSVAEASAYLRMKQLVLPQGLGSAFKVQRFDKGLDGEA